MPLNKNRYVPVIFVATLIVFLFAITAMAQGSLAGPDNLTGTLGIADPSTVVKCNGVYYVYGTGGGGLSSKDRKNWTGVGYTPATSQSWWNVHGGDMWAPDVTYKNGIYYCYYSVSAWMNFNSAVGLTTNPTLDSTAANYKWTDQGMVIDSIQAADGGAMVNVIDPSTFTDDNGKWYLAFGSFQGGVRLVELNPATGQLLADPPAPTHITNQAGEALAVAHWKSYYYYAISQGTCCAGMKSTYYISYARATNVTGPYTTKSGAGFLSGNVEKLLYGSDNSSATSGVVAVGVGGFFWDGSAVLDTLFMDYMAYTAPSGNTFLNIKPLYADTGGWLTFDSTKGVVITRAATSAVIPGNAASRSSFKNPVTIRLVNSSRTSSAEIFGELYAITGRKLTGNTVKGLPAGIIIEKTAGTK